MVPQRSRFNHLLRFFGYYGLLIESFPPEFNLRYRKIRYCHSKNHCIAGFFFFFWRSNTKWNEMLWMYRDPNDHFVVAIHCWRFWFLWFCQLTKKIVLKSKSDFVYYFWSMNFAKNWSYSSFHWIWIYSSIRKSNLVLLIN